MSSLSSHSKKPSDPSSSPYLYGTKRAVLQVAWPIGISMISYSLKSFVDTLMVGQLGLEALAGVGFAGILAWSLTSFPFGALRGQRPLVSQYLGAGDRQSTRRFGIHAFYFAGLISLVFFLFGHIFGDLTTAFGKTSNMSPQSADMAGRYLGLRMMWTAPMLLSLSIAEYLRSTERPQLPMIADLVSQPLNIVFNFALIFGSWGCPEMGIEGAAIGTGLADCCSLLILSVCLLPKKHTFKSWGAQFSFKWRAMKRVLSVGYTGGCQFALESGSFVLTTYFIGFLGTASLAVQQAAIQLVHLSILPAIALADGGSVLVGKYVGELEWDRARETVRSVLELTVSFMMCMALVFVFFGQSLMALFIKDPNPVLQKEALALSGLVALATAFWQVGDAIQVTYRHCLRATGDHVWVMRVGVLMSWILSVPLIACTIFWFKGTLFHAWVMMGVSIYFGAWIFHRRWKSGVWREKRLVDDQGSEPS